MSAVSALRKIIPHIFSKSDEAAQIVGKLDGLSDDLLEGFYDASRQGNLDDWLKNAPHNMDDATVSLLKRDEVARTLARSNQKVALQEFADFRRTNPTPDDLRKHTDDIFKRHDIAKDAPIRAQSDQVIDYYEKHYKANPAAASTTPKAATATPGPVNKATSTPPASVPTSTVSASEKSLFKPTSWNYNPTTWTDKLSYKNPFSFTLGNMKDAGIWGTTKQAAGLSTLYGGGGFIMNRIGNEMDNPFGDVVAFAGDGAQTVSSVFTFLPTESAELLVNSFRDEGNETSFNNLYSHGWIFGDDGLLAESDAKSKEDTAPIREQSPTKPEVDGNTVQGQPEQSSDNSDAKQDLTGAPFPWPEGITFSEEFTPEAIAFNKKVILNSNISQEDVLALAGEDKIISEEEFLSFDPEAGSVAGGTPPQQQEQQQAGGRKYSPEEIVAWQKYLGIPFAENVTDQEKLDLYAAISRKNPEEFLPMIAGQDNVISRDEIRRTILAIDHESAWGSKISEGASKLSDGFHDWAEVEDSHVARSLNNIGHGITGAFGAAAGWAQSTFSDLNATKDGKAALGVGGGIVGAIAAMFIGGSMLDKLGPGKWPIVGTVLKLGLGYMAFMAARRGTHGLMDNLDEAKTEATARDRAILAELESEQNQTAIMAGQGTGKHAVADAVSPHANQGNNIIQFEPEGLFETVPHNSVEMYEPQDPNIIPFGPTPEQQAWRAPELWEPKAG